MVDGLAYNLHLPDPHGCNHPDQLSQIYTEEKYGNCGLVPVLFGYALCSVYCDVLVVFLFGLESNWPEKALQTLLLFNIIPASHVLCLCMCCYSSII